MSNSPADAAYAAAAGTSTRAASAAPPGDCTHSRYLKASDVSPMLQALVADALRDKPTDFLAYAEEWARRRARIEGEGKEGEVASRHYHHHRPASPESPLGSGAAVSGRPSLASGGSSASPRSSVYATEVVGNDIDDEWRELDVSGYDEESKSIAPAPTMAESTFETAIGGRASVVYGSGAAPRPSIHATGLAEEEKAEDIAAEEWRELGDNEEEPTQAVAAAAVHPVPTSAEAASERLLAGRPSVIHGGGAEPRRSIHASGLAEVPATAPATAHGEENDDDGEADAVAVAAAAAPAPAPTFSLGAFDEL